MQFTRRHLMKGIGVGAIIPLIPSFAFADVEGGWPSPRGNSANTSHANLVSPGNELKIAWRHTFEIETTAMAVHTGDSIYVGVANGDVHSLETATGKPQWTTTIDGTPFLSITLGSNKLFIPTQEGDVFCLDRESGRENWQREFDTSVESPVTVSGSDIVFGTTDGSVVVIDGDNGNSNWVKSLPSSIRTTPAVVGDRIFIRDSNGVIAAFDKNTGTEHWRQSFNTGLPPGTFKGPVVRNGLVFVSGSKSKGSNNHMLTALDTASGEPIWEHNIRGTVIQLASAPDQLYSVHGNGLYALNPDNGKTLWQKELHERVRLASVPGALYTVSSNRVIVFDPSDGSVSHQMTFSQDKTFSGGPVAVPNGILVSDTTGTLWALSSNDGIDAIEFGIGAGLVGLGGYGIYRIRKMMQSNHS